MARTVEPSSRGRILLVEDDDSLRSAFGRVLRHASFDVVEARDGRCASEILGNLGNATFDLVISDIRLPDGTGFDVLNVVRSIDDDLPVVLMTGGADLRTAVSAVENRALHFLLKPIAREVLCAVAEDGVRTRQRNRRRQRALELYEAHESETAVRRRLGNDVEQAVDAIHMVYQPIVRYSSREVCAYEALVRSHSEAFRSPALLFEAATTTGLLGRLGRAIRSDVARTVRDSPDGERVFVNLHPHDLLDPELYDPSSALARVASRVTLEITEHASLDDIDRVRERTKLLHELGFRIAIDDLGAGHSSLAALAVLQPDVAKLDMTFTRGIDRDPTRRKLVRTLATLCADLEVVFVTEGVENQDELDALVEIGCDVFQGWHFAKPGPPFPRVAFAT